MSIHTDTGVFEGEIMLYVNDTRHLEHLIAKLEQVEGVVKVSRFEGDRTTGILNETKPYFCRFASLHENQGNGSH